jgi:transcriptional regulator
MHTNPAFRQTPEAQNLDFARARGFATLAVNGAEGPLLSHIPFLLVDGVALIHLTRSNPIARLGAVKAVLSVSGPDSYISPDWYGAEDQVPTWNYIAVHLRGRLEPMDAQALHPMVDALSDHFEAQLAPKPVWKSTKLSDGVMERMMRMILPFRLVIEKVDGTWKLGQNKTEGQRKGAVTGLRGWAEKAPREVLADLMAQVKS